MKIKLIMWCNILLTVCCLQAQQPTTFIKIEGQQFTVLQTKYHLLKGNGSNYYHNDHFVITPDKKMVLWWKQKQVHMIQLPEWKTLLQFASPYPALAVTTDHQYGLLRNPKNGNYLVLHIPTTRMAKLNVPPSGDTVIRWHSTANRFISTHITAEGIVDLHPQMQKWQWITSPDRKGAWNFYGLPSSDGQEIYFAGNGYDPEGKESHFLSRLYLKDSAYTFYRKKFTTAPLLMDLADNDHIYAAGTNAVEMISIETGETTHKSPALGRIFWLGLTPNQKFLYVLTQINGLFILDAKKLTIVYRYRVGNTTNAYSMGVTFSAEKKIACVTTPYRGIATLIDIESQKILGNLQIGPASAVFLFANNCLVLPTELPYE